MSTIFAGSSGQIRVGASLMIIGVSLLSGCDDAATSPTSTTNSEHSSCRFGCGKHTAVALLQHGGLSAGKFEVPNSLDGLQTALNSKLGSGYHTVSVSTFIDVTSGPHPHLPAVLVDQNGHLTTVLRRIEASDGIHYQVVHGDSLPSILSLNNIQESRFRGAWVSGPKKLAPVPITLADGALTIDKLTHAFGIVLPFSECTTDFVVQNRSLDRLTLQTPIRSSCGCTSAVMLGGNTIAPGDEAVIRINVDSRDAATWRQLAWPIFSKPDGAELKLALTVLGNQRRSMYVFPKMVDIGKISQGEVIKRTIRLREVKTDRFVVSEVQCEGLPVVWSQTQREMPNGLQQYNVEIEVPTADLPAGPCHDSLTIKTTSDLRPKVVVPIEFIVKADVSAVPGVVSFGNVKSGTRSERRIEFRSQSGASMRIAATSVPPNTVVTVHAQDTLSPWVSVHAGFSDIGLWQENIRFEARSDDGRHETLNVVCRANVRRSQQAGP